MALVPVYADPVTGIGANGWQSLKKLPAAQANEFILQNIMYLKQAGFNFAYGSVVAAGSIASGTFADINAGLGVSFTPRRATAPIFIGLFGTGIGSAAAAEGRFDINIDGVRVGNATYGTQLIFAPAANYRFAIGMVYVTTLSAAAHTVKPQWASSGGTISIDALSRQTFVVLEMGN